jgi:hypothetical protein
MAFRIDEQHSVAVAIEGDALSGTGLERARPRFGDTSSPTRR